MSDTAVSEELHRGTIEALWAVSEGRYCGTRSDIACQSKPEKFAMVKMLF